MAYYILNVAIILLFSFLSGDCFKTLFKLNYIKYLTPVGFFILAALLYPGYYFITLYQHDYLLVPQWFIIYTFIILIFILLISLVLIKQIYFLILDIWKNKIDVLIGIGLFIILFLIFINIKFDYRVDDINFYGDYIPTRIYMVQSSLTNYDYQSSYILFSVMLQISKKIFDFSNLLDIGYIFNVQGMLGCWFISFMFMECFNIVKEKFNNKKIFIPLIIGIIIFFASDYWVYSYPHFTGTLRVVGITYLLIMLYHHINDGSWYSRIALMFLFGGLLAVNSSGFFIGAIILYAYVLYMMINNKSNYIKDGIFFSIYIASFALLFFPSLTKYVLILYGILLLIIITRLDRYIEKALNYCKIGWIVMFLIPIGIIVLTYVFHIPNSEMFNIMVSSRNFFDNINNFDMVPDLFNHTNIFYTLFNCLFWLLVIFGVIRNYKFNNFFITILFVTIITFYNPFVFRFISYYITNVAYYRITGIIYNPIVLISLLYALKIKRMKFNKQLILGFLFLLVITKLPFSDIEEVFTNKDDYSYLYHTSQTDLQAIRELEQIHLSTYEGTDEELALEEQKNPFIHDELLNVASQVYGAQLFVTQEYTKYGTIDNLLEDRFAYAVIDNSEFEQVFARRIPGYELPDVDYNKACSLAYNKQLDYVVLDAQYNWELQTGLWPCSVQVGQDIGTYRILKMDYAYWQENIDLGYTQVYEVTN